MKQLQNRIDDLKGMLNVEAGMPGGGYKSKRNSKTKKRNSKSNKSYKNKKTNSRKQNSKQNRKRTKRKN